MGTMKITILCSRDDHPVNAYLHAWAERNRSKHKIAIVRKRVDLTGGDILFLISCSDIIRANDRALYHKALVMHASALPKGRGWSPHIWGILQGASELTLTLLEAEDKVDSGAIWKQLNIRIPKAALWDEINDRLFEAELWLMDFAIENIDTIQPHSQNTSIEPTYFPKRTPADSELNVDSSIASQFDLLRVSDPLRYPAHFEFRGRKYKIWLEGVDD